MFKKLIKLSPKLARIFLYLWLTTIALFFILVFSNAERPAWSPLMTKLLMVDILSGIGFFIITIVLAVIGVKKEPSERRVVLKKSKLGIQRLSIVIFAVLGFVAAYLLGKQSSLTHSLNYVQSNKNLTIPTATPTPTVSPIPRDNKGSQQIIYRQSSFSGPELWEAVNKKRVENGVGGLGRNDLLCSIASYRLNQLLGLGKLDNHAGFNELWQNENSQYYWIFQKYNVWEYIIYVPSGTATDAVNWWGDTLGHKTLLDGGQFTIGCTYAQGGFGVAIAGF